MIFKLVEKEKCELEGPYECECGGHLMVDATYLDQVGSITIICPYCCLMGEIPD